jgi:carboxylesterase type B
MGTISLSSYDGSYLANNEQDIVVSANYRANGTLPMRFE